MKSKYSPEKKFQIVMESFSENVSRAEICRRHGIYPLQLSKWGKQFIQGGSSALARIRNSDSRDEEINLPKFVLQFEHIFPRYILQQHYMYYVATYG